MNKKYLSVILFSALMLGTTGTFTSCKDYDDDINNLQEQVDKLKDLQTSVDGLKTSIDEAKAAAEQAKKDAADALAKAQEALDAAGGGDEALKEQVAKLEKAVEEQAQKIAKLEELSVKVTELESKIDNAATKEELAALKEEFTKLSAQFMNIVGGRLTSTTLIPEFHINGIPAITFTTLQYTPQVYVKNEHKGHLADGTTDHTTKPWLDHEGVKGAKPLYISTELNEANYQMNPNMGVTKDDVEMPSFDCIKSTNITTKAVDVANNKPIEVTGYDIKDGIMTVTFKKNKEFLGTIIGTEGDAHAGDKKETFYMASLKTPIAEANLTEEEKEKGEEVAVNSEYSRIEEIVAIPYLANSKTDFTKLINGDFADETQGTGDNLFYVHYHDSICLYNSSNNELVDVRAQYNEPLDLSKLVTVCVSSADDNNTSHAGKTHSELKNYADYGLEFRFAMASAKYLQGDLKTDEQAFGKILNGHFLKSEVYDVELGDNEYSKTSIGREPIVRVSLVDTKNNNLVAQRYIKVRWTGEKEQTIDAYTFDQNIVTCHDMFQQMLSQAMNENVYHKIKFDGGQSISKSQFHTIYTEMKINELRKDGKKIDLGDLNISTSKDDWNEGTDRASLDGKEMIKNDKDLIFAFIEDADDNTSFNLVWAMTPKTVGTLAYADGKYASTFEIDVEYVDPNGLNGNIKQTFKQTIVAPTQKFAYQGTYWKDGKGEGVFNVNPIVFRTQNDGWLTEKNPHEYDGCELKDYSHIEADLVNGYIYEQTKQKPTSLAQFIQYIRNCAEVKFVFDKDKFGNYAHLAGYEVNEDGTQLWKGTVGPQPVDNDINDNHNIDAKDFGVYDYEQDNNLAATINNFMGATAEQNKQNLPWDLDETLGNATNDCRAIIRLHEKDDKNGTDAAIALIGKEVPVKLMVAYNEWNEIPVQEFEVHFINPLAIDGTIGDSFVDAEIDGSFLNVAKNFKFTDWNGYKVASAGITDADKTETDKDDYAHQLYDYYAVKEVTFATDKTTTSLAWDAATNTYIHKDGVKDGVLPTGRSLKMMDWDEATSKSTAEEVKNDPSHLAYFNNAGTPVNVDYFLYIDVNVQYKWGTLSKNDLEVKVSKAGGTPSGK